ncbi:MAG: DNA recombination protein RmuC [Crocinitomicaceae bacterium]|nr:DNA recombination protein RmuC [Crocinitomicaceae bacterium]
MLITSLIVLLTISISAAIWFYSKSIYELKQKTELQSKVELLHSNLDEFKTKSIKAISDKEALERILELEKKTAVDKQNELKKQLKLVGKEIVSQGNEALKLESHDQLQQILSPLKEKLDTFEKKVTENNENDIKRFANMETLIKTLSEQHNQMHDTAQNLVNALKGEQKTQGDWGELALERILESSGLERGREYEIQPSFRNGNNEVFRPDVVIQLPRNKHIIIDAKVSLKAFERYINEVNHEAKQDALSNHITSMKAHIKGLGAKNYAHLSDLNSPDFVLLFMPIESAFALAMKEEPMLYQQAWDKKVVIVTPSTLLATLKTIEGLWKQERQNKHAFEIAEQAGRLYDKFVGFVDDLEKVGSKQREANSAFENAMSKLKDGRGNLTRSAEKLKNLGVKSKKQLNQKYLNDPE